MTQTHDDPTPAFSSRFGRPGSFAPDHFAYGMIQLAFLPWTLLEETTRRLAAGWTAEAQR